MHRNKRTVVHQATNNPYPIPILATSRMFKEYPNFLNYGFDIILHYSDITQLDQCDCLVNCTGPNLEHHAGIAKAITEAAGRQIILDFETFLKSHKYLEVCQVFATPAYNLKIINKFCTFVLPLFKKDIIIQ